MSGFYRKSSDGPAENRRIVVEPEAVLDWMRRSVQLAAYEQQLMEGLTVLPVTYEDNIRYSYQHQPTVDKICDFLGIASSPVASAYRKQTSGRWQDAIANHQELSNFLSNTPYARYLEEE